MNRNTFTPYGLSLFTATLGVISSSAVAQPQYTYTLLPEPAGTTASEPRGISYHETGAVGPKRYIVAGRSIDAAGVSHAAVWTEANDGTWGVELLPVTDPAADSDGWHVDSFFDVDYDIDFSAGSTGNPATPGGQQPAVWTCTGDPCTWAAETIIVPAGFSGGIAKKVVKFKAGAMLAKKVCGVGTDSSGVSNAVVWATDASGIWQPTLLPGLVDPDPGSSANSMSAPASVGGTQVGWSIVGAATNSAGQSVPARWSCDDTVNDCSLTASWNVIALPMLVGATQGEAMAMDKAGLIEAIASNQDITGSSSPPATHGAAYVCDGSVDDCDLASSWTVVELPPLSGFSNCYGFAIKKEDVNIAVGGSSDNGSGTGEVATDWVVDRSVSPPTVSVYDVSTLVPNLPANVALKKKSGLRGKRSVVITTNQGSQPSSTVAFVGDAAVLTEILPPVPTVNTWGLVVMALLTLVAGTVVYYRRGNTIYTKP